MDGTYAPQSPDLSGFTQQPHPCHHQTSNSLANQSTSYAPRSPVIPSYSYPPDTPPHPIQFNHNSHSHSNSNSNYSYNLHAYQQNQSALGDRGNDLDYPENQYMPPIPDLPPSHSFHHVAPLLNPNPTLPAAYYQNQQQQNRIPEFKNEASLYNHNPDDYISSPTMSSRGPRIKSDPSSSSMSMATAQLPTAPSQQTYKNPNPLNIEIKTKFPVARIKRIMQADEEVGKVAQVTPVAVSKALELFMISLVSSAADVAKEKGQKRVTAQHLKAVVLGAPEQFDFLAEIVGRVSEAQEGAGGEAKKRKGVEKEKEKADSESSEEEKKPKKGRGRRKKSAD